MPPLRVATTYSSASRRRIRSSSSQLQYRPTSSPLQDAQKEDDISVKEMSRRMLKRSLSGMEESGLVRKENATSGFTKKPKQVGGTRTPLGETQRQSTMDQTPNIPTTPPSGLVQLGNAPKGGALGKSPGTLSPVATGLRTVVRADTQLGAYSQQSDSLLLSSPFAKLRTRPDEQPALKKPSSTRRQPLGGRARSGTYVIRHNSTKQTFRGSRASPKRHTSAAQPRKTDRQDWLVPPPQIDPILHSNPRDIRTLEASFSREGSFFANSPQAFSTPARILGHFSTAHHALASVPKTSRQLMEHTMQPLGSDSTVNNVTMKESSPRSRMMLEEYITYPTDIAQSDSLAPTTVKEQGKASTMNAMRRRTHFHFSEDSIFSSALDFSQTMTIKRPLEIPVASAIKESADLSKVNEFLPSASTSAPVATGSLEVRAETSPLPSDREELRDLFEVFGIDGADTDWRAPLADDLEFTTPAELKEPDIRTLTQTDEISRTSTRKTGPKEMMPKRTDPSSTQSKLNKKKPGRVEMQLRSVKAISLDSSSPKPADGKRLPSVRMMIDDEPLAPSSDGEDELLLTSRGWDWEPGSDRV